MTASAKARASQSTHERRWATGLAGLAPNGAELACEAVLAGLVECLLGAVFAAFPVRAALPSPPDADAISCLAGSSVLAKVEPEGGGRPNFSANWVCER